MATVMNDVSFESYLQLPALSQSTLKAGRKSMAHLKAALDGQRVIVPSDAMNLGSALHCAFLEPELLPAKVALWPDGKVRRGKEWDAFNEAHTGKIILTEKMHHNFVGMIRSLRAAARNRPDLRHWCSQIEATELTIIGEVHGVTMKGRVDAMTPGPLLDLKKVADGDMRLFRSRAYDYGYHIQAYVYTTLAERSRFIMLTVEESAPWDVVQYEVSAELMAQGKREADELLEKFKACQDSGVWPGRAHEIESLGLPEYVGSSMSIEQLAGHEPLD